MARKLGVDAAASPQFESLADAEAFTLRVAAGTSISSRLREVEKREDATGPRDLGLFCGLRTSRTTTARPTTPTRTPPSPRPRGAPPSRWPTSRARSGCCCARTRLVSPRRPALPRRADAWRAVATDRRAPARHRHRRRGRGRGSRPSPGRGPRARADPARAAFVGWRVCARRTRRQGLSSFAARLQRARAGDARTTRARAAARARRAELARARAGADVAAAGAAATAAARPRAARRSGPVGARPCHCGRRRGRCRRERRAAVGDRGRPRRARGRAARGAADEVVAAATAARAARAGRAARAAARGRQAEDHARRGGALQRRALPARDSPLRKHAERDAATEAAERAREARPRRAPRSRGAAGDGEPEAEPSRRPRPRRRTAAPAPPSSA